MFDLDNTLWFPGFSELQPKLGIAPFTFREDSSLPGSQVMTDNARTRGYEKNNEVRLFAGTREALQKLMQTSSFASGYLQLAIASKASNVDLMEHVLRRFTLGPSFTTAQGQEIPFSEIFQHRVFNYTPNKLPHLHQIKASWQQNKEKKGEQLAVANYEIMFFDDDPTQVLTAHRAGYDAHVVSRDGISWSTIDTALASWRSRYRDRTQELEDGDSLFSDIHRHDFRSRITSSESPYCETETNQLMLSNSKEKRNSTAENVPSMSHFASDQHGHLRSSYSAQISSRDHSSSKLIGISFLMIPFFFLPLSFLLTKKRQKIEA